MKIAAVVNEDFYEMKLGANSSLAYILACVELGFEVFICDISRENNLRNDFAAIFCDKNNCSDLIEEYKLQNSRFDLSKKVGDVVFGFESKIINFEEIDFILQRLEPMKSPFPPFGKIDIDDFLKDFSQNIFTKNKKYNLPINCFGDKEFPLEIGEDIAVKTFSTFFGDENLVAGLRKFGDKIVVKPDNSAQGFGVFAIEFIDDGLDLAQILQKNVADFAKDQVFLLRQNLGQDELEKIVKILLFLQNLKAKKLLDDKNISQFSDDEINSGAVQLYNDKILVQPFMKGVGVGDIRIALVKIDGEFVNLGGIFRKNISQNDRNFTTGIIAGGAVCVGLDEVLRVAEKNDLMRKTDYILEQLNGKLRQKYENVFELGLDFLLLGDEKQVFLGEANHHCQGLISLIESVNRDLQKYDGGLGIVKNIVKNISK